MIQKPIFKGNVVANYVDEKGTRIKINDGGLVAASPSDPRVKAILARIGRNAARRHIRECNDKKAKEKLN